MANLCKYNLCLINYINSILFSWQYLIFFSSQTETCTSPI